MWDKTNQQNQKMWDQTNRQNAVSSYWTMRINLERSKDTIAPADYQRLRQQIDTSWKAINPSLDIPEGDPPK